MMLQNTCSFRKAAVQRSLKAPLLAKPQAKSLSIVRCSPNTSKCTSKETKETKPKEIEFEDGPLPTTQQVETFLSALCSETEIAQVIIKMPTYELKVRRATSPVPEKTVVETRLSTPAATSAAAPVVVVSKPTTSKSEPLLGPAEESVDDENSIFVTAKKVGIFRRGRFAGGKRVGKNNCVNEGDRLKKGQTLGFIEQLGTHVAVESPVAGELVKFNAEEGKPVEYSQAICEIVPFFGGYTGSDRAAKVQAA